MRLLSPLLAAEEALHQWEIMASVFGFKAQESFGISLPIIGLIAWGVYLVFLGIYRRTDLCAPWENRFIGWQLSPVYLSPLANFPGPKLAGEYNIHLWSMSCFSRPFTANEMDWRGVEEGETMLRFSNKLSLHGTRDITTYGSEAGMFGESRRCTTNMVWHFKVELSRCPVILNEASPPRSYH